MTEQLEAHGLYVLFIAGVLLLVLVMTITAIAEARRDRRLHRQLVELNTRTKTIQTGLVASRNQKARLLG